jgi:PAS domain S-box-containing protein
MITAPRTILDFNQTSQFEAAVKSRTKDLELITQSQEDIKRALLNVMEDLEVARDQLQLEKVKDDAILASIAEGLIAVDINRKIIMINNAAAQLIGLKTQDMLGKDVTDIPLYNEEGTRVSFENRPTQRALRSGQQVESVYYLVRGGKIKFQVAITVTPVQVDGKIIGAIDIIRDVTRESEIDRSKTEFVSLASHQLRTPLGIAKWYLEAIKDEGFLKNLSPTAQDYFNEVYKSNERLLSLVRDLLSVSRIEQGKVRNNPQKVNVSDLIKEIVKGVNISATKNKILIAVDIKNRQIPLVYIDPLRLYEVVENLLSNAIAYSHAGSTVNLMVNVNKTKISIVVADKGIGISEEDQKKLFTKFFRSETAVIKNTEGSGLGLYVVKSYVESWGGQISVKSDENKGSAFLITLPLAQLTKNHIKRRR